jgi:hypothetical protein
VQILLVLQVDSASKSDAPDPVPSPSKQALATTKHSMSLKPKQNVPTRTSGSKGSCSADEMSRNSLNVQPLQCLNPNLVQVDSVHLSEEEGVKAVPVFSPLRDEQYDFGMKTEREAVEMEIRGAENSLQKNRVDDEKIAALSGLSPELGDHPAPKNSDDTRGESLLSTTLKAEARHETSGLLEASAKSDVQRRTSNSEEVRPHRYSVGN